MGHFDATGLHPETWTDINQWTRGRYVEDTMDVIRNITYQANKMVRNIHELNSRSGDRLTDRDRAALAIFEVAIKRLLADISGGQDMDVLQ
jgi:hypothetical protein